AGGPAGPYVEPSAPPAHLVHFPRGDADEVRHPAMCPPPARRGRGAPRGGHFRVWAPRRKKVEVVFEGPSGDWPVTLDLDSEADGYFSGLAAGAGAGALYRFRLDDGYSLYPDPASRFQPDGPHGPSQVIDPSAYRWRDAGWGGVRSQGQVVYAMHIGTFTPQG